MASPKTIMTVRGKPITEHTDGTLRFLAGATIDADGSPRAYGPKDSGLDYTDNAGRPGRWWGIATMSGKPDGMPIIQSKEDTCPGYYISTTTYEHRHYPHHDSRRYVDSETVPFIVVPGPLRRLVKGVVIGCAANVLNTANGKQVACVVADSGPATHLGEISIAAAKALGIKSDPRTGGTEKPILEYRIWPGIPAEVNGDTYELQPA